MNDDVKNLWKRNAIDVVKLLRKKEVSGLEVLESCLLRIEAVNPSLNAIVSIFEEKAKENISEENLSGILSNMPVVIKDNTNIAGIKTTFGSEIYENNIAEITDPSVANIERNGGIIFAKTNLPEFAAGSHTYNQVFGLTKNPWNKFNSSGGSSGGSASALASGMAWFATGNDFGGSLRNPASWCGVVGLRPSPGLIPRGPSELPFNNITVEGPMARNVEDLALFLDSMVGYCPNDPISKDRKSFLFSQKIEEPVSENIRIGYTKNFGIFPCSSEVEDMINNTVKLIQNMGHVIENSHPSMEGAEECFQTLRAYNYYASYKSIYESSKFQKVKEEVIWNIRKGKELSVSKLINAEKIRKKIYQETIEYFDKYDFLIAPSSIVPPFRIDTNWIKEVNNVKFDNYVSWMMIAACISLTSCPSLALATSFSKEGCPFGIQIIAPPNREENLLSFAKSLEDNLNIKSLLPINPK